MSDQAMPVFAAALCCMDGRIQLPVIAWIRENRGVDYVDMITDAGPVVKLADPGREPVSRSMNRLFDISAKAHGSTLAAVVAHHDCAGNPVGDEAQIDQLRWAVENVARWGRKITVIGLWVDEEWKVRQVCGPEM